MRIADVTLFYGERSGGIRTYLDAKRRFAAERAGLDHHLIVPGARESHRDGRHELRSLRIAHSNGYRLPLGSGALRTTLRDLRPDVVLLHDPFWNPLAITGVARELGSPVVAVHHSSTALHAAGLPGPKSLYERLFRAWYRHAYGVVDAIMSSADPFPDCGRPATLPLRLGLAPAFHPRLGLERGEHVLYAGRLGLEKGLLDLLAAAARSSEPWPLRIVGEGPLAATLSSRIRALGIGDRVELRPFIRDPEELAREYAGAACVVMPGEHETFGLVALEAAASGAAVVLCESAPSAPVVGPLAERFAPGSRSGLLWAIERARVRAPNQAAAAALAARHDWTSAFEAELDDLERLL
jgi:alpha-1,6-mannosyltransferase